MKKTQNNKKHAGELQIKYELKEKAMQTGQNSQNTVHLVSKQDKVFLPH